MNTLGLGQSKGGKSRPDSDVPAADCEARQLAGRERQSLEQHVKQYSSPTEEPPGMRRGGTGWIGPRDCFLYLLCSWRGAWEEAGRKPTAAKFGDRRQEAQQASGGAFQAKGSPDMAAWFPDKQVIADSASSLSFTTWTSFAVCRGWSFLTYMLQFRSTLQANSTSAGFVETNKPRILLLSLSSK